MAKETEKRENEDEVTDKVRKCTLGYCNQDAEPESPLCIFHQDLQGRNERRFQIKFRDYFKKIYEAYRRAEAEERENIVLDCRGFKFRLLTANMLTENVPLAEKPVLGIEIPFKVNFREAEFLGGIFLQDTFFMRELDFTKAEIGTTYKDKPRETGRLTKYAEEPIYASFHNVRFLGNAIFNRAQFFCFADFINAVFAENANLNQTEFRARAFFSSCRFFGIASFPDAYFGGDTEIDHVTFYSTAEFASTKFAGDTDFQQSEFRRRGGFNHIKVEGGLKLTHVAKLAKRDTAGNVLSDERGFTIKPLPSPEISIRFADFYRNGKILLNGTNVANFSLIGTTTVKDPTVFDFEGAEWGGKGFKKIHVYDELNEKYKYALIERITEVYRRLRANYEARLAYGEAGDFFSGEMRTSRLSYWKRKKGLTLFFSVLYCLISGYGQGFIRPIVTLAVLGLIFSFGWYLLGIPDSNTIDRIGFGQALEFSYKTFFTLPSIDGSFWQFLYGVLQKAVGAGVITLFILALRRAFRR